ncbi:MAG: DUF4920 domain-containing protein [Thermodesulfovibrionales bacterium]|nr:DUF4920 domain-containing protein [Thermodesulfovibrionales bacterium]
MKKKFLFLSLFITILAILLSCSSERYGAEIDKKAKTVQIKDIFLNKDLDGKIVTVEGTITTQCQSSGCWFFISDGTAKIFVNLSTKGFTIPPKTGKKAKVMGQVISKDEHNVHIIAHGVEIL